jgi:DNA-binding NarL/FixJ family response regulator
MNFWQYLWRRMIRFFSRLFGYPEQANRRAFPLEVGAARSLQDLAEQQQRSEDEVAAELIHYALAQREALEGQAALWNTLTEREQQVAALVCLGFTNRLIAARLHISTETCKTHVRNVLIKFGLHRKSDLRYLLAGWDFSQWS